VYVNGHLIGTTPTVFGSATGLPLTIGGTLSNELFKGDIDEVRLWNVVRTAGEIRENMHKALAGTESGLVGYWQFNEGDGSSASDPVGGNAATLVNGAAWSPSTIPFGAGSSVSIAGFTSGTASAGTATITTTDAFDGPVDLTVTEVDGFPNTTSGTTGTVTNRYWIIDLFGAPGTFSVDLTLTLEPNTISATDIATPSGLKLYRRNSNSDGAWTEVAAGSSATDSSVTFAGITSFSQFTIGSQSSPLPVQLSSFTALANRLNAELQWRTETEIENHGFEIERRAVSKEYAVGSKEKTDQPNSSPFTHHPSPWVSIGFVQGFGTSSTPREYSFTDKPDQPGRYAYRIKQIDQSGTFTYTSTLEVLVGLAPLEFTLSQNYPNPFNPTTTIEFTLPADGHVVLKVYDLTGGEVATLVDQEMAGGVYQRVTFDATRLASGIYFARLVSGSQAVIRKMLLLK
jgi:hypothetical protein